MFVVVPLEEFSGPTARIQWASEPVGVIRPVLQRLELRFRERVIVRNMRSRVGFSYPQVRHQQSHRFGGHRATPVGMDSQLIRLDVLTDAGGRDQFFGQAGRFAFGDQPADHIAAENIQDVVQVVVSPFGRTQQPGNVPAPELVGLGRQQLRLDIIRVAQLITAFAHLIRLLQNPVHRAHGTQILPFIDQRCINFPRRLVLKTLAVENLTNDSLLRRTERSRRDDGCHGWFWLSHNRLPGSVETAPGQIERLASFHHADRLGKLLN